MKHFKMLITSLLVLLVVGCSFSDKSSVTWNNSYTLIFEIGDDEKGFITDFKGKMAKIKDGQRLDYLQDKMLEAIDGDFRAGVLALIEEGVDINCKLSDKEFPESYTAPDLPVPLDPPFPPLKRNDPYGRYISIYDIGQKSGMIFQYNSFLEYAVLRGKSFFVDLYLNVNTDIDILVLSDAFWQAVLIEKPEFANLLAHSSFDLRKELKNVQSKGRLRLEGIRNEGIWKLLLENGLDPDLNGSYPIELEKKLHRSMPGGIGGYGGKSIYVLPFIFQTDTPEILELLIKYGADLNVTGCHGETLLHNAIINHHREIVEILVRNGAEVNSKDINGDTPLILHFKIGLADIEEGNPYWTDYYDRDDNVYRYRERRVFTYNFHHYYYYYYYYHLAETLIDKGADINLKTKEGMTTLHYAAALLNPHGIELLTEHGGDINAQDKKGNTPLHIAVMHSHDENYLKIVIECGANVNIVNNEGDTPLDIIKRRQGNIISVLETASDKVK